jgi:hypothetical protein
VATDERRAVAVDGDTVIDGSPGATNRHQACAGVDRRRARPGSASEHEDVAGAVDRDAAVDTGQEIDAGSPARVSKLTGDDQDEPSKTSERPSMSTATQ